MIEEDLKTLFDAQWDATRATTLSLTQTSYVFMKTAPHTKALDPPAVAAANVVLIILSSRDTPIRHYGSSDLRRYEGTIIIYGVSHANMETAITELKKIFEENTTGNLIYIQPMIEGDPSENSFLASMTWEWIKIVARS